MTRKGFIKLAAAQIVRNEMWKRAQVDPRTQPPVENRTAHPYFIPDPGGLGWEGSEEQNARIGAKKEELDAIAAGEAAAARDARGIVEEARGHMARRARGKAEEQRNSLADLIAGKGNAPLGMPYPELVQRFESAQPMAPIYAAAGRGDISHPGTSFSNSLNTVSRDLIENIYGSNFYDQGFLETFGETATIPISGLAKLIGTAPYQISDAASNVWDATKEFGSNAWDATKEFGSNAWDAITGY